MNSTNLKLLSLFVLGSVLWFLPVPDGLTEQAWQMMVIFVTTVLSLILAHCPWCNGSFGVNRCNFVGGFTH